MKISKKFVALLCVMSITICNMVAYADIHGVGHDIVTGGVDGEYTPTGDRIYNTVTLTKGTETRFHLAAEDTGYQILWASGNTNILETEDTTLPNIKIKAVGVGTTTLTAYKRYYIVATGKYDIVGMCSIPIVVTAPKLISIDIEYPEVYLNVGETLQNSIIGWYPANAEVGDIVWSSNNSDVATVSENGLITGVAEGTATIYAKSNGVMNSCTVIISAKNQNDSYDPEEPEDEYTEIGNGCKNILWKFKDGVLFLKGTGEIPCFSDPYYCPWDSLRASITSVKIDNGITHLGNFAFYNCSNLSDVELGNNISEIGDFTFANCSNMQSIRLPDNVTSIGRFAFTDCERLASLTLPPKVKIIGTNAFSDCGIESINLPNAFTDSSVGMGFLFGGCSKLKSVFVDNDNTAFSTDAYGVLYNKDMTDLLYYPAGNTAEEYELPDGVTTISDAAFGAESTGTVPTHFLKKIILPATLKSVGTSAFCVTNSLKEVVFKGTEDEYAQISIANCNEYLVNSMKTFVKSSDVKVTSIILNTSELTMNTGESQILTATVLPSNATNKTALWSSSNTNVAMVSSDGIVTAIGEGTATITVTAEDGGYTDTCSVIINSPTRQNVSMPVSSVSSGDIIKGTCVSLSTETDGATIYYTIDGSTPSTTSLKYTQSILINDNTTIKAYAIKEGMEDSAVSTFTYTITEKSEDKSTISISDKKGKAGDIISLTLDISNNPGISGMILKLAYDEGITLTEITAGTALSDLTFTPPAIVSKNPCTLLWDGITKDNSNGTVLTLTFKISDTATEGEYNVRASYTTGDIYDDTMKDVDFDIDNGIVTVRKYKTGDVNEDDVINAKDITILRKYISGDYGVTANEDAADVNKDGILNAKDITVLRKFVSGDYGIVLE